MDLNQKKRDALDARLKSEIDGHCALDETRAALEEAFRKESDMYIGHLQAGQKAMEALSEVYENGLSENAVYQGTYHNEPEKKKDALEAISFANSCSQIRDVLLRSAVSFGAQGLQKRLFGFVEAAVVDVIKRGIDIFGIRLGLGREGRCRQGYNGSCHDAQFHVESIWFLLQSNAISFFLRSRVPPFYGDL